MTAQTKQRTKLLLFDLDGTLLCEDHITVSQRTKKALYEAHEKGIKIAVATGRTLSVIYSVIDQLPFIDMLSIQTARLYAI